MLYVVTHIVCINILYTIESLAYGEGGVVGSSLYMQMYCDAGNSSRANCTLYPSSLNIMRLCSQGGDDSFIVIRV